MIINYIRYEFVVRSFCQKEAIIAIIADRLRMKGHACAAAMCRGEKCCFAPFNSIDANANKYVYI